MARKEVENLTRGFQVIATPPDEMGSGHQSIKEEQQ